MSRLRDSRHKFLSRFRSLPQPCRSGEESDVRATVQTVMIEEWEGLKSEVWGNKMEDGGYLEHVLGVMDELKEELIREGGLCQLLCVCYRKILCLCMCGRDVSSLCSHTMTNHVHVHVCIILCRSRASKSGMVRVRGRKPWVIIKIILCAYTVKIFIAFLFLLFCRAIHSGPV